MSSVQAWGDPLSTQLVVQHMFCHSVTLPLRSYTASNGGIEPWHCRSARSVTASDPPASSHVPSMQTPGWSWSPYGYFVFPACVQALTNSLSRLVATVLTKVPQSFT